jgi:hypothetical protein
MTTTPDLPTLSEPAQSPTDLSFLGSAPLIRGEEVSNYDTLLARISGAVKPADILEEIWVRDVVDLVWDAIRMRRLKAALMTVCAHEGMQRTLSGFAGVTSIGFARQWATRDEAAVAKADALLASAGLTIDSVMAQTLRVRIGEVERIDRMAMAAEARRNVALHEIERHRAGLAKALRRVAHDVENGVEDAEFEVIAPPAARDPAEAAA